MVANYVTVYDKAEFCPLTYLDVSFTGYLRVLVQYTTLVRRQAPHSELCGEGWGDERDVACDVIER